MYVDADNPREHWKTSVDFTVGGTYEGAPIGHVIHVLDELNK